MDVPVEDAKTRVFLSYSRKDSAIVVALSEALTARGYFVDYDQGADAAKIDGGIAPTDAWWERLKANIAAADVVVFAVSPDSIASRVCDDEIVAAQGFAKRLVPALVRPIDFAGAPVRLAALNVAISLAGGPPFGEALDRLCAAIDTDIVWLREGRRLLGDAMAWRQAEETPDRLLLGADISAAEAWIARRPANAPPPSDLTLRYIAASRAAEAMRLADEKRRVARTRRLQRGIGALVALAAILVLSAGWGLNALTSAQNERVSATLARNGTVAADAMRHERAARFALAGMAGAASWFGGYDPSAAKAVLQRVLPRLHRLTRLEGHTDFIGAAAFSPDGARILTGSQDDSAAIFDAASGKRAGIFTGHTGDVMSVAWLEEGTRVLTLGRDRTLRMWDAMTFAELARYDAPGVEPFALAVSADGRHAALTTIEGVVLLLDARTLSEIARIQAHAGMVWDAAFSPSGDHLATGGADGGIARWDMSGVATGRQQTAGEVLRLAWLTGGALIVETAARGAPGGSVQLWPPNAPQPRWTAEDVRVSGASAVSPDGAGIVVMAADNSARILNPASGAEVASLIGHDAPLFAAIYIAPGRIATGASDGSVRLWDSASGANLAWLDCPRAASDWTGLAASTSGAIMALGGDGPRVWASSAAAAPLTLAGHSAPAVSGRFGPGDMILTASEDGTARTWQSGSATPAVTLDAKAGPLRAAIWSADGTRIATAGDDGRARIWNAASGEMMLQTAADLTPVASVAFSPDASRLLTTTDAKDAALWDTNDGHLMLKLVGHGDIVMSAVFAPDGTWMLTGSLDGTARIWDPSGRDIAVLRHGSQVISAIASPDGEAIATAASDGTVKLWGRNGALRWTSAGDAGLTAIAFARDGSLLAATATDGRTRIVQTASGATVASLGGHAGIVWAAAFNADASRVATAGDDGTVRIWEIASARETARFDMPSPVISVALSVDERRLLAVTQDATPRLWQLTPDIADPVAAACETLTPFGQSGLTDDELASAPFLDPQRDRDPCNPPGG